MAHKRVLHVQRGFHLSESYAKQVMRDHCSITWVVKGETIRDTTDEERIAMMAQQAQMAKRQEPLEQVEISGIKFERPKTTNYRPPSREAYEELEDPLCFNICRWPRRSLLKAA